MTRSVPIKDFFREHREAPFIDRKTFYDCYEQIEPHINPGILVGYLAVHGLIKTTEDKAALGGGQGRERLLQIAEEVAGGEGFMILYMCLYKSRSVHMGHAEAVKIMDEYGMRTWLYNIGSV